MAKVTDRNEPRAASATAPRVDLISPESRPPLIPTAEPGAGRALAEVARMRKDLADLAADFHALRQEIVRFRNEARAMAGSGDAAAMQGLDRRVTSVEKLANRLDGAIASQAARTTENAEKLEKVLGGVGEIAKGVGVVAGAVRR